MLRENKRSFKKKKNWKICVFLAAILLAVIIPATAIASSNFPEVIHVNVIRNGEVFMTNVAIRASQGWSRDISGLPKYDVSGNEFSYTVVEVDVPGFNSEVRKVSTGSNYQTFHIINTPVDIITDESPPVLPEPPAPPVEPPPPEPPPTEPPPAEPPPTAEPTEEPPPVEPPPAEPPAEPQQPEPTPPPEVTPVPEPTPTPTPLPVIPVVLIPSEPPPPPAPPPSAPPPPAPQETTITQDSISTITTPPTSYVEQVTNGNSEILDQIYERGYPLITIGDFEIPLHALSLSGYVWALFNLILSIAGIALGIMLVIRILLKNIFFEKYEHFEDNETREKQSRPLFAVFVPVLGFLSIVVFILTQDMTKLMVLIDMWTIIHLVLFITGLVSYIMAFKRTEVYDDDNNYKKKDVKISFFRKHTKEKAIAASMIAILLLLSIIAEPAVAKSGNDTITLHIYKFWNQEPPGPYTVTFETYGLTPPPASQKVPHGGLVFRPDDPVVHGKVFEGWYLDPGFNGQPWDFDNDIVPYDENLYEMVLYAKWEYEIVIIDIHMVFFHSNGGTPVSAQSVFDGERLYMPEDPWRDGDLFDGWYLDPDFHGQPWDFNMDVVTGDMVLYAKWVSTESLHITYDLTEPPVSDDVADTD